MKLVSTLATTVAAVAFALSFLFDRHALAFYAIAFSAALVLVAVGDYAPRIRRWTPRRAPAAPPSPARSAQRLRLAA